MREYFMETERTGFSKWNDGDLELAKLLWGDSLVTRHICAAGRFTEKEIEDRLGLEIKNGESCQVQYWPFFELDSGEFVGCCGLRPCGDGTDVYELGFHLRTCFWGRGYAEEAARAVIHYAYSDLHAKTLRAGHHPENKKSRNLLLKLGFLYDKDCFYAPTGLYHPSYILKCPGHDRD